MSTAKKIILQSSDKENFEVDEKVAIESQTIKHMIEDECADNAIPLPNVSSKILAKVIEYCKRHVEAGEEKEKNPTSTAAEDALKTWDADFANVDQSTLFDYILLMMVVDYGGAILPIISHSPWNGIQLADLVMPFFLFIAGVSLALVYKRAPNRLEATWKACLVL